MDPSAEIRAIHDADQRDRTGAPPADVIERDAARRARVREVLDVWEPVDADDWFHAALVFQHGDRPEDFERTYELAVKAAGLGHPRARRPPSASSDRG
jgi:hypothetical protein